ncbi:hypothetical protein HanIR_Chr15g0772621 [Helianthus annuus]|nr:hypothetical protein HanIR_Chr15g0772621 [Helianthus annuus]
MLWWKRVERRTQDETKETRLLSTVNYGPTVIYGRHDFCCFLHRKPGLTHRNLRWCLNVKSVTATIYSFFVCLLVLSHH